jgi:DNA-binding transcriptional MocR family regulator
MWNIRLLNTDKPLYIAIANALENDIRSGILHENEKLPTYRELAKIIGVNVTTISRAYKEAEKRGLIYGTTGSGTFVKGIEENPTVIGLEERSPNIIDMSSVTALGHLEPNPLPIIEKIMADKNLSNYMRYSTPEGYEHHRDIAAKWVERFGISCSSDDILICAGTQHAIICSLLACFKSGDKLAVDTLTFPGIQVAAAALNIKLIPISMDHDGMIPHNLESLCQHDGNIKGIYLMPNIQNPTAKTMSNKRKNEIADIIKKYDLILIEDDVYSFSNCNDKLSITSKIRDNAIFISGIAKIMFPGLRVSFVVVPKKLKEFISHSITTTMWMVQPLNIAIITECIKSGLIDDVIKIKTKEIKKRLDLAISILKDFNISFSENSMFIWLELPSKWSVYDFEIALAQKNIAIVPSRKFYIGNSMPPNAIRISLSSIENIDRLKLGLETIRDMLNEKVCKFNRIM